MKCYVLHTMSNMELTVKERLIQEGLKAVVPMEERLERRMGVWTPRKRILMQSYVFVYLAHLTPETYYTITAIPGVIRFLGTQKPSSLPKEELDYIEWLIGSNAILIPSTIKVNEEGTIKVIDGPLVGKEKSILKCYYRYRKVKVQLILKGKVIETTLSAQFI
ncbi:MAG: transcription termination/antitermination NusG family protein [Eubacterium sp.]